MKKPYNDFCLKGCRPLQRLRFHGNGGCLLFLPSLCLSSSSSLPLPFFFFPAFSVCLFLVEKSQMNGDSATRLFLARRSFTTLCSIRGCEEEESQKAVTLPPGLTLRLLPLYTSATTITALRSLSTLHLKNTILSSNKCHK